MKKRIILLFIFLFSLVFGICSINAQECEYYSEGVNILIEYGEKDGDIVVKKCDFGGVDCLTDNYVTHFLDGSVMSENQCLGSIAVCTREEYSLDFVPRVVLTLNEIFTFNWGDISDTNKKRHFVALFPSSLDPSYIDDANAAAFDDKATETGNNSIDKWINYYVEGGVRGCPTAVYTGPKLDDENMVYYCTKFDSMLNDVDKSFAQYANCGKYSDANSNAEKAEISKCRARALSNVDRYINVLKNTCNDIMANAALTASDGCIRECIRAIPSIQMVKDIYLEKPSLRSDCSISERLVAFIQNIIKWIKYILPIVVIILGILDFLKAIVTNNDDSMKKAQGRFVKRLIAAALTFVVPLILEFIIEKMGFDVYGCGIINF